MSIPPPPPPRRPPPHVYWRRRILVVFVLTGLIALTFSLVGRMGGDDPPNAIDSTTTTSTADTSTTTSTTTTTTTTTLPEPPPCVRGDIETTEDPSTQWATVIVDTERRLPEGFTPTGLTSLSEAGFDATWLEVRDILIDDLRQLGEAAEANGTPLAVLAAYRSFTQQADILAQRITELGEEEAHRRAARPGHSEHQLGTTVDVTSAGLFDVDQAWGASETGRWVAANAHLFGFIISYPEGREEVTCYAFEPWHLRYVGRSLAAEVHASGLTLREYLFAHHPPAGWSGG